MKILFNFWHTSKEHNLLIVKKKTNPWWCDSTEQGQNSYLRSHSMIQAVNHIIQEINVQFLVEVQQLSGCVVS